MNGTIKGFAIGVVGFMLGLVFAPQGVHGQSGTLDGTLAHIGFAVSDADQAAQDFGELFGVDVPAPRTLRDIPWGASRPGETMAVKFTSFSAAGVSFELLQGVDGDSPWGEHIARHGEGMHHLAIAVPDLPAARERLLALGGRQTQAYSEQANYIDMEPRWPFTIELVSAQMPEGGGQ